MMTKLFSLWMVAAEAPAPVNPTRPAGQEVGGGDMFWRLIMPLLIVFAIMYIFILGPQRKREKQRRQMLDAVGKGDDVVTIGGLHGKVWQIKDDEIVLTVDGDTKLTFTRGAIARVVKPGDKPETK